MAVRILITLLQIVLCIGAPVLVVLVLRRRSPHVEGAGPPVPFSMALVGVGALTFVASQVVHIPFLLASTALLKVPGMPGPPPEHALLFNAVFLGLAAGVCEEVARWLALRYWQRQARSTWAALQLGAGHGGLEAVLIGLAAAVTLVAMVAQHGLDPAAMGVPADKAELARTQIDAYWNAPLYIPLLGGLERCMAVLFHLSASVLVMRAICRNAPVWLLAAILWHALLDGVAVYVIGAAGGPSSSTAILTTEAAMAVMTLGSVAILWKVRCEPRLGA